MADRTLDRAALIVHADPTKYSSPIGLLECLREVAPETLEGDDIPAPTRYAVVSGEREVVCLDSCLEELSARDRDLII